MSTETSNRLLDLYGRLRAHFGYAPVWWPGSPPEIFVTAILVQQCDWAQAWKACGRLGEHGLLKLPDLADTPPRQIESLISPVAFAPTKSERLVALGQQLVRRGHRSLEEMLDRHCETQELREDLLSIEGIGQETADCILLYASQRPVFVIDSYTRRTFARLGLFPGVPTDFWLTSSYKTLQHFFTAALNESLEDYRAFTFDAAVPLAVALFRDFHAQIVELGKHHCLRSKPRCHATGVNGWTDYFFCESHCINNACTQCPLSGVCAWGKDHVGGRE